MRTLWLPLIVLVTGLCASLQAWRLLDRYERGLAETRLSARAEESVTAIGRSFSSVLNDLQTIGAVFECSEAVTPEEFKVFSAPTLNQSHGPLAVLWVPLVTSHQSRGNSPPMRQMERDAGPQATILPAWPNGAEPSRTETFSVAYIEPYHRRRSYAAQHLATDPALRDTLIRARTTGRMALSQRTPVDGNPWGFVAVLPVRDDETPAEDAPPYRGNLSGYVVGVYRVEAIVEAATRGLTHAGIEVALFDRSAPEDKQILYWGGLATTAAAVRGESGRVTSPMLTKRFAMGDRQWEIVSRVTPWYVAGRMGWSPLIAAAALFVSTLMIVWYIVSLTRRHEARKEAEDTLRSNEEFLRILLERSPVPMVVETRTHEFVLLSRSFSTLFGYTGEDIRSFRDWWNVAFPDEQDRNRVVRNWFERVQKGVMNGAEPDPMIADVTCKGGSVRHIEFIFSSYGDRTLVVFNDLTDRLQRQEALRCARDEAEQASRAKSRFLATVSHELRTPLNGVIGMAELLKGTELDTQQECFLKSCRNRAESLRGLINDILDFSKIEAGEFDLQENEFALDRLVEETADLMARRAHAKAIELLCSIDPHARQRVRGDSVRVRQILVNLASNAIKFTEAGEVAIRVHIQQTEGDFVEVRFSVTDTGIGIPKDRIDRLFDPFAQADDSTTRRHGGSGVGLAISKRLAEMMNGQIKVESEEGRGSTFWFEIRLGKLDGQSSTANVDDQGLQGRRALIVDDNRSALQILDEQLSACGMTCESAASVDEALVTIRHAEVAANSFDVVLADFSMPGRDGCDLAALFADRMDLPVIVLSAFDTMLDSDEQRRLGIARCLSKPAKQSELLKAVVAAVPSHGSVGHELPDEKASDAAARSENVLSNIRILVAEGNETGQTFLRESLGGACYECDVVGDGRSAVSAVQAQSYDMVLMDCRMPEMDGLEATRQIRKMEQDGKLRGRIPIIAFTASAIKGDRERCIAAGMDDHFHKPVSGRELLDAIGRFLGATDTAAEQGQEHEKTKRPGRSDAAAPIDTEALYGRCLGNVEFAESLLTDFARMGGERVGQILRSLEECDATGVADTAHSLKGTAAIVAAEDIRAVAAQLEATGRSGDLKDAKQFADQLRVEMQSCVEFILQPERQVGENIRGMGDALI